MKKVVGISLGGGRENFGLQVRFMGQRFEVRRLRANGSHERAAKLVEAWQDRADAIGLGFAQDGPAFEGLRQRFPVTTGARLGEILQEWALRDVQQRLGGYFNNARVLFFSGRDNYKLALSMSEHTQNLVFADPVTKLGVPGLLGSLDSLELYTTSAEYVPDWVPDVSLPGKLGGDLSLDLPEPVKKLLLKATGSAPEALRAKAAQLHRLIRGRVTVLPPDSRRVDYDVVPITIAEGCLLNCGFCRVKSGLGFKAFSREEIFDQMRYVKRIYADDLANYNAVFLGQHDALEAGTDINRFAAETAYELFEFEHSHLKDPVLFLFGTPLSIVRAEDGLLDALNSLPYSTFINIGMWKPVRYLHHPLQQHQPIPITNQFKHFS